MNKSGVLSYGTYLSSNTKIDAHNKFFVKLGTSRNTKIINRFSFGWSYDGLFSKDGLLLAAFEASQVAQTEKFQKSYEILYRYKLAYAAEVSADLQVVQDTIDRDENLAIVSGVRLRIIF